jgi:opacity protein-like surface antigen
LDDPPSDFDVGYALGLCVEMDVIPSLKVGPYYSHQNQWKGSFFNAAFNSFGVRSRFVLPIAGSVSPYAFAGIGYSLVSYTLHGSVECIIGERCTPPFGSGHFVEMPLGVGVALQVSDKFQLMLDVAYRPGFAFGGEIFDGGEAHPAHGWSIMFGAGLRP